MEASCELSPVEFWLISDGLGRSAATRPVVTLIRHEGYHGRLTEQVGNVLHPVRLLAIPPLSDADVFADHRDGILLHTTGDMLAATVAKQSAWVTIDKFAVEPFWVDTGPCAGAIDHVKITKVIEVTSVDAEVQDVLLDAADAVPDVSGSCDFLAMRLHDYMIMED